MFPKTQLPISDVIRRQLFSVQRFNSGFKKQLLLDAVHDDLLIEFPQRP